MRENKNKQKRPWLKNACMMYILNHMQDQPNFDWPKNIWNTTYCIKIQL